MPQLHPLSLLSQRGRARPWLLTALVVLVLTGAGWWWKTRQATNAPAAATQGGSGPGAAARRFGGGQTTQPVSVGTVQRQDIRVLVSAIGTVTARNTATVRAKVDGELQAIRFKEGDMVRAGQLLAEIDPRSYQATLDQAQGTLARDQALLRNAELDLQRYRDLLAKDSIARQQVDTQEALVRQNQGTVQSDQAQVNSAKLQLSYTRITAPIAGRLGLRQADLGNVVHASDTNGIVTITQVQPINAVFSIPEASLPQVTARLHTGAELPVQLWDRDQKTRLATGKLETVDNAIDTTTGTIKAKASFANADSALFPNQFVNAVLQVDTLPGVLTIPTTAVQRGSQGTYVYALKDDKTVTVRRIRLGVTDGDRVSVHGDLAEGEHVVTDGADRLREGAQVAVIAPDAAAKADQAVQDAASRPRGGNGAAMMRNLPPDVAAKVQAMSPEERRAYFRKLREQNGGAPGAGTASPGTGGNAGGSTGSGASGGEGHERRQPPAEGTERRQRASGAEAPAAAPAAGAATSR